MAVMAASYPLLPLFAARAIDGLFDGMRGQDAEGHRDAGFQLHRRKARWTCPAT